MSAPALTFGEAAELLDRYRDEDAAAQAAALRDAARLAVLETFDAQRRALGHDYGSGQRAGERARLERDLPVELLNRALETQYPGALANAGVRGIVEPLEAELVADVFRELALPRLRRLERETYRARTAGTARTLRAWRATAERLGVTLPTHTTS